MIYYPMSSMPINRPIPNVTAAAADPITNILILPIKIERPETFATEPPTKINAIALKAALRINDCDPSPIMYGSSGTIAPITKLKNEDIAALYGDPS